MKKYKNQNDGVQYLFVTMDCFSEKAFVHPFKNKKGPSVKKALIKVLEESGDVKNTVYKRSEMHDKTDSPEKTNSSRHSKDGRQVRFS